MPDQPPDLPSHGLETPEHAGYRERRLERARTRKTLLEIESLEQRLNRRRVFYLNTLISDQSIEQCIEICERWASSPQPITIMIDSPGGSVFSGFALFDFLRELGATHEVETCAFGYAASMAVTVLQAGTTRSITPNSYVMIHEAGSVVQGTTSALRDQVELSQQLQDRVLERIVERSHGVTMELVVEKTHRRDWWIAADEALALGLVDKIRRPA